MSPKQTRREHKVQLSVDTYTNSKRLTRSNWTMQKDLKKKEVPGTKHIQHNKHLCTEFRTVLFKDENDVKDFNELIDSSDKNSYTDKSLEKTKRSKYWSNKAKVSSYATKLSSSPVISQHIKIFKNSPTNSSSHKIHFDSSSNVLKTSRKLTLTTNSLTQLQKSNELFNSNNIQLKLHMTDTTDNAVSKTSDSSNHSSACSTSGSYSLRSLLKSTEMALNSSTLKLRSKNLMSPKPEITTVEHHFCTNNRRTSELEVNKTNKVNVNNILEKEKPVVLLQRLSDIIKVASSSSSSLSSSMIDIHINDRFNDNSINISRKIFDSILCYSQNVVKFDNKKYIKTKCNKKNELKITRKLKESTTVSPFEKSLRSKVIKTHEFDDVNETFSESFIFSTPKDKEAFNETNNKYETEKTLYEKDSMYELNEQRNRFDTKNNVTLSIKKEQEEVKGKNETYELIEPKTPKLRELCKKRNVEKQNLDQRTAKANLKVRFISPSLDTNYKYNISSRTNYNKKKQVDNLVNISIKNSTNEDILKSSISASHKKSNSINGEITSTINSLNLSPQLYRNSNSFANINQLPTSPFISSIKKRDSKCFTMKEVPNFAKIHKKMFAKSESIIDAKRRLRERHTSLTACKITNSNRVETNSWKKNQLFNVPNKNCYNRFGFKMRKCEATDCILRNNTSLSTRIRQQNKIILKGVRTNRRFELQMKSRNINL